MDESCRWAVTVCKTQTYIKFTYYFHLGQVDCKFAKQIIKQKKFCELEFENFYPIELIQGGM
jgi:hypothetical protein